MIIFVVVNTITIVMARGKNTCKILKEIRRQIAEANDIAYVIEECKYKGDCLGTCPKCEAEVRYLEEQLRQRQLLGKAVMVAGLSAGVLSMVACTSNEVKPSANGHEGKDLLGEMEVLPAGSARKWIMLENGECESSDTVSFAASSKKDTIDKSEDKDKHSRKKHNKVKESSEYVAPALMRDFVERHPEPVIEAVDTTKSERLVGEIVEQLPTFPGGTAALMKYISENMQYPELARQCSLQGRVVISFVVNEDGSLSDFNVVKSVDPVLDKEALRVVSSMPDWIPGESDGTAVKHNFSVPVTFKLAE